MTDSQGRDYVALAGTCIFFRHHMDENFFKVSILHPIRGAMADLTRAFCSLLRGFGFPPKTPLSLSIASSSTGEKINLELSYAVWNIHNGSITIKKNADHTLVHTLMAITCHPDQGQAGRMRSTLSTKRKRRPGSWIDVGLAWRAWRLCWKSPVRFDADGLSTAVAVERTIMTMKTVTVPVPVKTPISVGMQTLIGILRYRYTRARSRIVCVQPDTHIYRTKH
jgi:hypothetical protein